jgi:hypothetical protein
MLSKQLRFSLPLLLSLLWMGAAMAVEEPKYQVLSAEGSFEVRHYAPVLIAEVLVDGDMGEASGQGFRQIADYIFGNNQSEDSAASSKIAMTAPVSIEPQSTPPDMGSASQWRVSFVMPSQYTRKTIPKPKNKAVSLREVPEKYVVVLKYSGFNSAAKVQRLSDETLAWGKAQGLKILGQPQLARYDPPWTLPMFRRNEIMLEVAAP